MTRTEMILNNRAIERALLSLPELCGLRERIQEAHSDSVHSYRNAQRAMMGSGSVGSYLRQDAIADRAAETYNQAYRRYEARKAELLTAAGYDHTLALAITEEEAEAQKAESLRIREEIPAHWGRKFETEEARKMAWDNLRPLERRGEHTQAFYLARRKAA